MYTRVFPPIRDLKHSGIIIGSLDLLRGPTVLGVPVRASVVASASQKKKGYSRKIPSENRQG